MRPRELVATTARIALDAEYLMAFIYTAGGLELNALDESRESITEKIAQAELGSVLEVQVLFPAGNAQHPSPVTVAVAQIAAVSGQPLPRLAS